MKKGLLHTSFALLSFLLSYLVLMVHFQEIVVKLLPFADEKMFLFFQLSLAILFYFFFESMYYSVKTRGIYVSKFVLRVLILLYMIFMFYLLFYGRENVTNTGTVNLEFFHTIRSYIRAYQIGNADFIYLFTNLIGNVVLFIPIGYLLSIWLSKRLKTRYLFFVAMGLFSLIECLQLVYKIGSFDVDDIFLNVFGGGIGLLIAKTQKLI